MHPALIRVLAPLASIVLVLGGCARNDTPGGSFLYDLDVEPPRLLDARIRMETYRTTRPEEQPQVRLVETRDGAIFASVDTGTKVGEGTLDLDDYGKLWRTLIEEGAFDLDKQPADTDGGYFHVISLRLGDRVNELSAQDRTNFLGVYDGSILRRLDVANAITEALQQVDTVMLSQEQRRARTEARVRAQRERREAKAAEAPDAGRASPAEGGGPPAEGASER